MAKVCSTCGTTYNNVEEAFFRNSLATIGVDTSVMSIRWLENI